jgi:hypothetical protein
MARQARRMAQLGTRTRHGSGEREGAAVVCSTTYKRVFLGQSRRRCLEDGWIPLLRLDDVTSGKSGAHGWLHPVHGSQACGSHGLGQTEASQGPHQSAHATNIMVGCSGQDGKQCSHPIVMHLFGFVHGDTSMRVNTLQSRAPLPSLPEDLVALLPCSLSC